MATSASSYLPHLTSTINSLSGGLVEAKSGATRSINSWIETLSAAGDTSLSGIADELKKLETVLNSDDLDTSRLQKSLQTLGQHTTRAATAADGATAEKIQQLGQLLTDAAGQLK